MEEGEGEGEGELPTATVGVGMDMRGIAWRKGRPTLPEV
jgi:hypothetical protein